MARVASRSRCAPWWIKRGRKGKKRKKEEEEGEKEIRNEREREREDLSEAWSVGFLALGIGMQMALSRGANGFRREAGGVDEPARATDVFYALSPTSLVARCSFSPVKDTGMRFAESSRPTISLYAAAKTRPLGGVSAPPLSLSLFGSRGL